MSCYQWQTGEYMLPAEAVAEMRRRIVAAVNLRHERALAFALAAHEAYKLQNSESNYGRFLDDYKRQRYQETARQRELQTAWSSIWPRRSGTLPEVLDGGDEHLVLGLMSSWHHRRAGIAERAGKRTPRPIQPTHKMIDSEFPRPGARASGFSLYGGDLDLRLEGRILTWNISGEKSVDYIEASYLMSVVHGALDAVRWTKGTGGSAWGSNESIESYARQNGSNPIRHQRELGPLAKTT